MSLIPDDDAGRVIIRNGIWKAPLISMRRRSRHIIIDLKLTWAAVYF